MDVMEYRLFKRFPRFLSKQRAKDDIECQNGAVLCESKKKKTTKHMHTSYESDSRPLGGPLNGYSNQSSMTCSAGGYSNQRFTGSIPSPSPLRSSMSSDGSMGLLSRSPTKTSLSRTNGRSGSYYRYPTNQDEVLFK